MWVNWYCARGCGGGYEGNLGRFCSGVLANACLVEELEGVISIEDSDDRHTYRIVAAEAKSKAICLVLI